MGYSYPLLRMGGGSKMTPPPQFLEKCSDLAEIFQKVVKKNSTTKIDKTKLVLRFCDISGHLMGGGVRGGGVLKKLENIDVNFSRVL